VVGVNDPYGRILGFLDRSRYFSIKLLLSCTHEAEWTPCSRQILEKKWEYNETVHQLFIDFKKAYDSVKREVVLPD
jgi:hypothetical protein